MASEAVGTYDYLTAGDKIAPVKSAPVMPVSDALGCVDKSITHLRETVERLEERLGVALSTVGGIAGENSPPSNGFGCTLSDEVMGLAKGVEAANAKLTALLQRIAL